MGKDRVRVTRYMEDVELWQMMFDKLRTLEYKLDCIQYEINQQKNKETGKEES